MGTDGEWEFAGTLAVNQDDGELSVYYPVADAYGFFFKVNATLGGAPTQALEVQTDCLTGLENCGTNPPATQGCFYPENPENCPADCTCGDGICSVGYETTAECPDDCFCGDGVCNTDESYETCPGVDGCAPPAPNCDPATASWIADGWCDAQNNNPDCLWDGGDCCEESCIEGAAWPCGQQAPFDCCDPAYNNTM